jgi:hypothetical protein
MALPGRLFRFGQDIMLVKCGSLDRDNSVCQCPINAVSNQSISLLGHARKPGLRKLQISNALMGYDKWSILLDFCKAKRVGFSNPVIVEAFRRFKAFERPQLQTFSALRC